VYSVLDAAAHFLAELQAVDAWHHPVAHDHAHRFLIEGLPGLLSIACAEHLVSPMLQGELEDLHRYWVIFSD
jgi:hypothetical protein